MVARHAPDDASVVVGAGGGGALASEPAQKVVALEAGGRHVPSDDLNGEWAAFTQLGWLDARATSGDWRVARDFAGLPA